MKIKTWIKETTKKIKTKVKILFFALSDASCPWYAKAWGYLVFTYALSPIDLIPDFIPVIGYLDDLIIIPLGIWIFVLLVTKKRWNIYEDMIKDQNLNLKKQWYYAIPILILWIIIISIILYVIFR